MKIVDNISILTFVAGFIAGRAAYWIWTLDLPFYAKALSVSLILLSALLLCVNDFDKMMLKESMKK
jgi:hypothetical protein